MTSNINTHRCTNTCVHIYRQTRVHIGDTDQNSFSQLKKMGSDGLHQFAFG